MIYYLHGKLTELSSSFAVVECGGVAYGATISAKTYNSLISDGAVDPGGNVTNLDVKLYTSVKLRDQSIFEVFGFISKAEREAFSLLQTVSGVGPKAALAVLSSLSPEQLCSAIRSDDIKAISSAQGVGPKAAQKICIDLKNKIDAFCAEHELYEENVSRETLTLQKQNLGENEKIALEALINLGYTKAQAQKAISKAEGNTVEELIRTSLSHLYN